MGQSFGHWVGSATDVKITQATPRCQCVAPHCFATAQKDWMAFDPVVSADAQSRAGPGINLFFLLCGQAHRPPCHGLPKSPLKSRTVAKTQRIRRCLMTYQIFYRSNA